ncbi:tetratricopeptide repeat protein, partial [Chitinophagales bacterium]|nr:tetratricopeptide repeat protein [Chitinophagales bacterium]
AAIGDESMSAQFSHEKANILRMLGEYDDAIKEVEIAISYYLKNKDINSWAKSANAKAQLLNDKGFFSESTTIYMEVLNVCEEAGDQIGVADAYVNLTNTTFYLESFEESVKYGEKAISIYKAKNDKIGLARAYDETAMSLLNGGKYDKALNYVSKALSILESTNPPLLRIGGLNNSQGNVLKYMKRYDEALAAYQLSYDIAEKLGHEGGISATSGNIADVYMRMGRYKDALPFKQRAIDIMEKNSWLANYNENLDHLSTIYKELGNYEKALHYQEKLLAFRDSSFTKAKEAITQELTTKYETQEKTEQLAQNEREQLFLYALLAMLLIGAISLGWAYLLKRRSNRILSELNVQKEFLIKEVHHRVKNNLQIISSLLNFQSRTIDDKGVRTALLDSQSRVRSMSLIHQKLYRGEQLAAVEMKSYLGKLATYLVDAYSDEEMITVELAMDPFELDVNQAIPLGLIANELITNSLKHAFPNGANGTITIELEKQNDYLFFQVADNGIGKITAIMQEKEAGFGEDLIDMLTQQLGGELKQTSTHGIITSFKIPHIKAG